jgi:hypothetical protein
MLTRIREWPVQEKVSVSNTPLASPVPVLRNNDAFSPLAQSPRSSMHKVSSMEIDAGAGIELDLFGMDVNVDLGMDSPARPSWSPTTLRTMSCEDFDMDELLLQVRPSPPCSLSSSVVSDKWSGEGSCEGGGGFWSETWATYVRSRLLSRYAERPVYGTAADADGVRALERRPM